MEWEGPEGRQRSQRKEGKPALEDFRYINDFHKQFLSSSGVRSQIACSQGLRGGREMEAACFCTQGALKEKLGTM